MKINMDGSMVNAVEAVAMLVGAGADEPATAAYLVAAFSRRDPSKWVPHITKRGKNKGRAGKKHVTSGKIIYEDEQMESENKVGDVDRLFEQTVINPTDATARRVYADALDDGGRSDDAIWERSLADVSEGRVTAAQVAETYEIGWEDADRLAAASGEPGLPDFVRWAASAGQFADPSELFSGAVVQRGKLWWVVPDGVYQNYGNQDDDGLQPLCEGNIVAQPEDGVGPTWVLHPSIPSCMEGFVALNVPRQGEAEYDGPDGAGRYMIGGYNNILQADGVVRVFLQYLDENSNAIVRTYLPGRRVTGGV